jgi:hypothetical protein
MEFLSGHGIVRLMRHLAMAMGIVGAIAIRAQQPGSFNPSFQTGTFIGNIGAIALQADGKVLVAGCFYWQPFVPQDLLGCDPILNTIAPPFFNSL